MPGVRYKNGSTTTDYYFVCNWRGDVIRIYDGAGTVVANYNYDAWGNVISVTDANGAAITDSTHIANVNPLRYRGYYYDSETGLYYLQSRYYDPAVKRFINADGYVSTGLGLSDYNMYSYCGNNPICRGDNSGSSWQDIKNSVAKAWNSVKGWASRTFGCGTTLKVDNVNKLKRSDLGTTTIEFGEKESVVTQQTGNTKKPISAYRDAVLSDESKVTWGVRLNLKKDVFDIGTTFIDTVSVTRTHYFGNNGISLSVSGNWKNMTANVTCSAIGKWDSASSSSIYVSVDVDILLFLSEYYMLQGVNYQPTVQPNAPFGVPAPVW